DAVPVLEQLLQRRLGIVCLGLIVSAAVVPCWQHQTPAILRVPPVISTDQRRWRQRSFAPLRPRWPPGQRSPNSFGVKLLGGRWTADRSVASESQHLIPR